MAGGDTMNVSRETLQKVGMMNRRVQTVTSEIEVVEKWIKANRATGAYFEPNVVAAYRRLDVLYAQRHVLNVQIKERAEA